MNKNDEFSIDECKDPRVPASELDDRLARFRRAMNQNAPEWRMAVVFSKVNLFYFTGTRQDSMLMIPRDGDAVLWVRRSYERAQDESLFRDIRPMESYRDAAGAYPAFPAELYMETEFVPLAHAERFRKYFPYQRALSADGTIAALRSVKSGYELAMIRRSGQIHRRVLEERVPGLLREGMSEAAFVTDLYSVLIEEGHHGIVRFNMLDTEMPFGQVGFGTNSLYPTYFNGPGGCVGLSPAVPLLGSRERKLKKGDVVFVDIGCGYNGYHTDKTAIYAFGGHPGAEAQKQHDRCVAIQSEVASLMKPGVTPESIYRKVVERFDEQFLTNFMGFGNRRCKFLGHSIGLQIDETPVIADGFRQPICEGMVFALEPKKGIPDVGMVGTENTFLVTPDGGVSLTGDRFELMMV